MKQVFLVGLKSVRLEENPSEYFRGDILVERVGENGCVCVSVLLSSVVKLL